MDASPLQCDVDIDMTQYGQQQLLRDEQIYVDVVDGLALPFEVDPYTGVISYVDPSTGSTVLTNDPTIPFTLLAPENDAWAANEDSPNDVLPNYMVGYTANGAIGYECPDAMTIVANHTVTVQDM